MNPNLSFDFTVDRANHTIHIRRAFAGSLDLVWDAWTLPELLDQWWAPRPYRTETKSMDFTEGGTWLYAMISPENEKHWCKNDYRTIAPGKSFSGLDAFCDEHGAVNAAMPRTLWTNVFTATDGTTLMNITALYDNLADLEKVIAMGFKEGLTMALGNLDELLLTLNK